MKQDYEILAFTPNPVQHIERCGRTAYKSQDKITEDSAVKFIRMLIKRGHESVLEHSSATVLFKGCSRAFAHQLVRHRLMAVTQESQRYCDESGFTRNDYYVIPKSIKELGEQGFEVMGSNIVTCYRNTLAMIDRQYLAYLELMNKAKKGGKLSDIRKPQEDARFILPNAVCSEIVITANFREWRHIFSLRCHPDAQWEIRDIMKKLLDEFHVLFFPVFEDLYEKFIRGDR